MCYSRDALSSYLVTMSIMDWIPGSNLLRQVLQPAVYLVPCTLPCTLYLTLYPVAYPAPGQAWDATKLAVATRDIRKEKVTSILP